MLATSRKLSWALLVGGLVPATQAAAADIEAGRKVAEQHCSRCHVVGGFNPNGGISSTPSFQLLVERRPDYQERFATFYARRPHPAFLTVKEVGRPMAYIPPNAAPVEITLEDVANIAAFVETLKGTSKTLP